MSKILKYIIFTSFLLLPYQVIKGTPFSEHLVCDAFIEGPIEVCPGETNTYTITNLPPNAVVNFVSVGCCGAIGTFTYDNNVTINLQIFETNPTLSLCVNYSIGAISCTTCINIVAVDESVGNFSLSGPTSVCAGTEAVYFINPVPGPGADITFSATNGTVTGQNGNEVTVLWDGPGDTGELCLTYDNPCGDEQVFCLDIDIIQPPGDAILSGLPEFACLGDPFTASIMPTDFPSISWTVTNGTFTTPTDGPEVEGIFSQAGTAEICVSLSVGCNNDAVLCETVTVSPPPNPTIAFTELCGLEGFVTAFDTRAGSSFLWEQVSGPGNILFGDDTFFAAGFIADEPGEYIISLTETLGNCQNIKTIKISLFAPLDVSPPVFICGPNGYRISFTIEGGKPPVRVNGTEIFQPDFTSEVIPYGSPFNFRIEDAGLCREDLNGVENCPCRNSAGTMRSTLLTGCDTASVTAVFDSNAVLLPENVFRFVLHTKKNDTLGNILAISRTPVFSFLPAMKFDSVYYISRIVADSIGSGINLNDPCLQVSKGQPVIFYRTPLVNIIDPGNICGTEVNLLATADLNVSGWYWKNAGITTDTVTILKPDTAFTNISVDKSGTYAVTVEANNKICFGRDTLAISFSSNPEINISNIECNDSLLTYILEVTISNGVAPYTLDPLTTSENVIKISDLPVDDPYSLQLTDANGCISNLLQGIATCSCFSDAGTMPTDTLRLCADGGITPMMSENDVKRDINDTLIYILHDNPNSTIGFIYAKNGDSRFSFNPGYPLEQVLYISRVTGNKVSDTLDLEDPCLSVAPGQPVIFYPAADPLTAPDLTTCGTTLTVAIELPENQNFRLTASDPSGLQILIYDRTIVQFTGTGTREVNWTTTNPGCTTEGTWEITFYPFPTYSTPNYTCLPARDSVNVIFSIQDPSGLFFNGEKIVDTFDKTFATSDLPFELYIQTVAGCRDTIVLNYNCQCFSVAGTMALDTLRACENLTSVTARYNENGILTGDTSFFILHTLAGNIIGDILAISDNGLFTFPAGAIYEKVYYISYVNYSSLFQSFRDDPCAVITPGQPVIFHANPTLATDVQVQPCTPEAEIDILTDAPSSGWTVRTFPPGSNFMIAGNKLTGDVKGQYTLDFFAENRWCKNTTVVEVMLFDRPVVTESLTTCEDTTFVVNISWQGGEGPYTIENKVINGNSYTTDKIPSGEIWSAEILDARGCSTGILNVTKECNCTSFSGSLGSETMVLCEGENAEFPEPEGAILLPGQVRFYDIFVEENGQEILLTTVNVRTLLYNPSWLGDTLWVRPVISLPDGDGNVNRNDPCLAEGEAIVLIWKEKPEWTLPVEWSSCPEENIVIPVLNPSGTDFTLYFRQNNQNDSIKITGSLFDWAIQGSVLPEIIEVTGGSNIYCQRDTSINILVKSSVNWFASIPPEFIFYDTTNMFISIETDLKINEIASVEWAFQSSGTIVYTDEPQLQLSTQQTGPVIIAITDTNGCTTRLESFIQISDEETDITFLLPNIMIVGSSANGIFGISPADKIETINRFSVYDRWGNLQFDIQNSVFPEFIWNGSCIAGNCPDGVYAYYLQCTDKSGMSLVFSGDVTILNR